MPCDHCGKQFDHISTRWPRPHSDYVGAFRPHCHVKANCCDGAPLAE